MKLTSAAAALILAFCANSVIATPTPPTRGRTMSMSMRFQPDVMRKATGEEKNPYIIPQFVLNNYDLKKCLAQYDAPNNKNNSTPNQTPARALQQLQKAFRDARYGHIYIKAAPKPNNAGFIKRIEKYIESLRRVVTNAKGNKKPIKSRKRKNMVKRDFDVESAHIASPLPLSTDETHDPLLLDTYEESAPEQEGDGLMSTDESTEESGFGYSDLSTDEGADELDLSTDEDAEELDLSTDETVEDGLSTDEFSYQDDLGFDEDAASDSWLALSTDEDGAGALYEDDFGGLKKRDVNLVRRDVKLSAGCKRPEDVLVQLLQIHLKNGARRPRPMRRMGRGGMGGRGGSRGASRPGRGPFSWF